VFLQQHHSLSSEPVQTLLVKLYEFDQIENIQEGSPIRVIEADQNIFSDVFIFECCKDKSQYLLTVEPREEMVSDELCCTMSLLSFVEMNFEKVQECPLLKEVTLDTVIRPDNVGFGINSPYYNENLQFLIEAEADRQLTVAVNAPSELKFEMCLIPNAEGQRKLTQLKLETIINESSISSEKNGTGIYTIKTVTPKYLLVINAFTALEGSVSITLSMHGRSSVS
jgi:hypothetical protein